MKFNSAYKLSLLFTCMLFNNALVKAGETIADVPGEGMSLSTILFILIIGVIGIIFGAIPILTKLKSRSAEKIVTHAANKDTFWDVAELKKHAEKTFYSIQEAWQNRSMDAVKDVVDKKLYSEQSTLLNSMKDRQEKNIISQIQISEIRIIGIEDYIDDSKDRYIAYIQGRLLDYVINETTQEIIKNPSKTLSTISVSYHFVRNSNTWILENIDHTVTLQEILQMKNFSEK